MGRGLHHDDTERIEASEVRQPCQTIASRTQAVTAVGSQVASPKWCSKPPLWHIDADGRAASRIANSTTPRASPCVEFCAPFPLHAGTSAPVERWIVRLMEWFLAPSRANSDERRERPRPRVTGVRRDRRLNGQGSKSQGPTGQCKASINPAAVASLSAANWQTHYEAKPAGFGDHRSLRWSFSFGQA